MNGENTNTVVGKTLDYVHGAGDAARHAAEQVRDARTSAMEDARDVGREAADRAKSLVGAMREQAATAAATQKDQLADRLSKVADAVHRSGEALEGEQDWFARIIERGADELGGLAGELRGADVQTLLNRLSGFARREPALFLGAAMVVGFGLTRVGRLAAGSADRPAGAAPTPTPKPAAAPAAQQTAPPVAPTPQFVHEAANPAAPASDAHMPPPTVDELQPLENGPGLPGSEPALGLTPAATPFGLGAGAGVAAASDAARGYAPRETLHDRT